MVKKTFVEVLSASKDRSKKTTQTGCPDTLMRHLVDYMSKHRFIMVTKTVQICVQPKECNE